MPGNTPDNEKNAVVPSTKNGTAHPHGSLLQYSGPLPPASEFAKYEQVLHGSANRILGMAEGQSKHRRFIEKMIVIFDSIKSLAGLIFALAIIAGGMWAGVYLIMHEKSTAGFVAILVPLFTVAGAFIYQQSQKQER